MSDVSFGALLILTVLWCLAVIGFMLLRVRQAQRELAREVRYLKVLTQPIAEEQRRAHQELIQKYSHPPREVLSRTPGS